MAAAKKPPFGGGKTPKNSASSKSPNPNAKPPKGKASPQNGGTKGAKLPKSKSPFPPKGQKKGK